MSQTKSRDLLRAEFAKRLNRLMTEKGYNQSELARAAEKFMPKGEDFRRDNVSLYIRGLSLPRPKHLTALAKVLNVTAEDLLPGSANAGAEDLPYSLRPVLDDPARAWLQVDMKVPMRTALAVLSLLEDKQ